MGTPDFAVPSLRKLIENNYKPLLCVTQPDKPKGRKKRLQPTPVKEEAIKEDISVYQPEDINSLQSVEKILSYKPQIIITVAYGGFIGKRLRNTPQFGAINLHPSLLPVYRGSSPINYALFKGDEFTGNTIFRLVAKMDAGPIIYQTKIKIDKDDNHTSLSDKLANLGANDIISVLKMFENDSVKLLPQDETKATYTKKIEKSDLVLNLNDYAENIINRIRGLALNPGARIPFKNNILKILKAHRTQEKSVETPYTITKIIKDVGLQVATRDFDIIITMVQPAGKKIMNAFAFNLGARLKEKDKLI